MRRAQALPHAAHNNCVRARHFGLHDWRERQATGRPCIMDPRLWGAAVWATIHYVALGYPDHPQLSDRAAYAEFLNAVGRVLPCLTCAQNFERHIAQLPPLSDVLESGKDALFAWTVDLHNLVNRDSGRPSLPQDGARALYESGAWREGGDSADAAQKSRERMTMHALAVSTVALACTLLLVALVWWHK